MSIKRLEFHSYNQALTVPTFRNSVSPILLLLAELIKEAAN